MQIPKKLPPGAKIIDALTPNEIAVASGTTVTLLRLTVPQGWIGVIEGIGHALEISSAFSEMGWGIKINGIYVSSVIDWRYWTGAAFVKGEQYRNMKLLLGPLWDPFRFPVPFVLKPSETFEVEVQNSGTGAHQALMRIIGYAYAPSSVEAGE